MITKDQDNIIYFRQDEWCCATLKDGTTKRAKSWAALDSLLKREPTARSSLWPAGASHDYD